jgi:GTP cyclohydrolase IA
MLVPPPPVITDGEQIRYNALADAARTILWAIGDDPAREGLRGTPDRFARAWLEFLRPEDAALDTTFEAARADQLIVLGPIQVWSFCEHHILPFWCDLTIGYLPSDRILGASKLARIAKLHGRRLQVQERLVNTIAEDIANLTGADRPNPNVAVLGRGHHLCMMMRGAECDAPFVTSALFGAFRDEPALRQEFFTLANGHA